jgi:rhomboid protease GluP
MCSSPATFAVFVGMSWSAKTEKFTFDYLAHDKNAVNAGEYWRLLTSTFVHPVFFHVALNMLVHVQIGRVLERVLGSGRYLVLYLLSGLSGAFLFQILAEPGLGMGASGAVYGEAAALLLAAFGRRVDGDLRLRPKFLAVAAVCILGDQVVALVWEHFEKGMRIAVSAHLGGFVGGTLLGFAMVPPPLRRSSGGRCQRASPRPSFSRSFSSLPESMDVSTLGTTRAGRASSCS